MEYTIIRDSKGEPSRCTGGFCRRNFSIKEFFGFCEVCWVKLTPAERAALKGEEVPQVEVKISTSPTLTFVGVLWRLAVTASIVYFFYRDGLLDDSISYVHQFVSQHAHHIHR